ncbi:MAG: hypothetical protein V1722_01290 [Candidatus Micrarchaeota archaeon]
MTKVNALEVRKPYAHTNTRIVKLPGHEISIEHFLPENYEILEIRKRAAIARSKIDPALKFVIKEKSRNKSYKLEPISEARLASHINNLQIPGITAEEPLAVILGSDKKHKIVYQYAEGQHSSALYARPATFEERHAQAELEKHGITPHDTQWFSHSKGITLTDIEHFEVTDELRKKLKLKYTQGETDQLP